MMDIERMEAGLVTVLHLHGDVDMDGVNTLRVELLGCLKSKRVNLVVDLSGVGFISYLGIGVLLERMRQMRAAGGDLKLAGLNLFVKRTFHMASVTKFFSIYDTEPQAVAGFREAA